MAFLLERTAEVKWKVELCHLQLQNEFFFIEHRKYLLTVHLTSIWIKQHRVQSLGITSIVSNFDGCECDLVQVMV